MLALLIVFPDAASLHLWLNAYYTPTLDVLFRALSVFVEWPVYVVMAIVAIWRWRWTVYFAVCEATSALIVQLIKHIVQAPRPAAVFGTDPAFQAIVVDGVNLHTTFSFPSGHTASYFIFFTVWMLILTSHSNALSTARLGKGCRLAGGIGAILATLGAFSRIYLSQHFLLDVTVGSLIGIIIPLLYLPFYHYLNTSTPRYIDTSIPQSPKS